VLGGEKMAHAAVRFNVPPSTLFDRVKMARKSGDSIDKKPKILNKPFKVKYNANYTAEDLENAIQAIMEGGKISHAAKAYNIPNATLFDHVKKIKMQEKN
jgi:transposase-like protein